MIQAATILAVQVWVILPFSSQVQFEYSWGEPPIGPLKLNLTARVEVVHVVVMFA